MTLFCTLKTIRKETYKKQQLWEHEKVSHTGFFLKINFVISKFWKKISLITEISWVYIRKKYFFKNFQFISRKWQNLSEKEKRKLTSKWSLKQMIYILY